MGKTKAQKLQYHPDREEIISRLISKGQTPREVCIWLNRKYSKSSRHNRVSVATLNMCRKEVLAAEGKVLGDILEIRKQRNLEEKKEQADDLALVVQASSAYKDKLSQIVDNKLDVATRIIQLDAVIGDRIEHWFNLIKSGEAMPDKADYEMRKYIDQQMALLRDWKKMVEGMADKRVDYNVNITVMNEQIQGIQSIIRDLICEEMGPEKAIDFLDKLSNRLGTGAQPKALPAKVMDVTHEAQ